MFSISEVHIKLIIITLIFFVMVTIIYVINRKTIRRNKRISFGIFLLFWVITIILNYFPETTTYIWTNFISWPLVANYIFQVLEKKEKNFVNFLEALYNHEQDILNDPVTDIHEKNEAKIIIKKLRELIAISKIIGNSV